jgi:ferric-dicitrate binding protein FerR (iron transport regulator)
MEKKFIALLEKFLRKEANAEEVKQLKELFGRTEPKKAQISLYEQKWERASSVIDTETDEQMWNYLKKQITSDTGRFHTLSKYPLWKKGLRIAASLLIPIVFTCLGYYYSENKPLSSSVPVTIHTNIGQKTDLSLPDGTLVWLNSASSLQYDNTYNQKERTIYLQGEAYFEVSKDAKRPFIVKADGLSVEAVGTSFNVKAYPADQNIVTTLIEGSVRVSDSYRSEWLSPNEKLTFRKNGRSFVKDLISHAKQSVSWRDNQLVFAQERMEDIARTLERMYGVRILFASEDLKNIHFSGKIRNTNLDGVMQMIAFAAPVRYSIENDSVITIQRDDSRIHEKIRK